MGEVMLSMWAYAVESGRITIEFVPIMYRNKVKEIIGVGV